MNLRSYLWSLRLGTLLALGLWCIVLFATDPTDLGLVAYIFFYLTFFLFTSGLGTLILGYFWQRTARKSFAVNGLSTTLRQGILLGLLFTLMLVMQQYKIFFWWSALLVAGAIFMVELFFLTKPKK